MEEWKLTDISEICEKFNVTSRTLRFYEEEGLIESTRDADSTRRQYTVEQIGRIREILTLRTIGISIKEIKAYLKGNASLKEVVQLRKAEIIALVDSKMREIKMLNETLMAIDDGEDVLGAESGQEKRSTSEQTEIVRKCAEHIVKGELDKLYPFFSKQVSEYMPIDAFKAMWRDSTTGAGDFVRIGETTVSSESDNIVFQKICFSKVNIQLKFVFRNNIIHGLWTSYVE
ncbi:MAG: MerR family transcriptional regulator [Acetatifactor sp.]